MVKHISSEYVKRGGESMYVRIPQGFIVVTDEEGNTEDVNRVLLRSSFLLSSARGTSK